MTPTQANRDAFSAHLSSPVYRYKWQIEQSVHAAGNYICLQHLCSKWALWPARHVIGYFGDGLSRQAKEMTVSYSDNQKQNNYEKEHEKNTQTKLTTEQTRKALVGSHLCQACATPTTPPPASQPITPVKTDHRPIHGGQRMPYIGVPLSFSPCPLLPLLTPSPPP